MGVFFVTLSNSMSRVAGIAGALLLLSVVCLWAQALTGAITGTVKDSTGAVVAGATVTVTNPATNTQRTSASNTTGLFNLTALPPGVYNMKVEKAGFSAQVRNPLFGQPDTSPGSPTYGQLTSIRIDPRDVQLALKVVF